MTAPRTRTRTAAFALGTAAALLVAAPAYWAVAAPGEDGTADAAGQVIDVASPQEAAIAADATAVRLAAADIVDVPVSFTVVNQNRTLAECPVDGGSYRIEGHLTAPRALLEDGTVPGVTLYQHGIAAGEWYWRLDAEGYHHAEEMALRGHASVTVDRLGYGASDHPDGYLTCIGGEADIAHQITRALREGTYTVADGDPYAFDRVYLAGQSNGGQISQIAAYSFQDIDGLVIMDWTDLGLTPQANARFFTALNTCLNGAGGEGDGYVYYDLGTEEFRDGNFHDTDPEVLRLALPHQNPHPCGDMVAQLGGVLVDLRHLNEITVPVLFLYGEKDARVEGGAEHRALFTGTDDTELLEVPEAGHYMGLERGAPLVHDALADWLDRVSG
ncbi:alpha/beta hydrolase [Streptomyces xiamenensis]|uniref:alpha/beta hydrolase n=1 Tax=Streptomyces xiamenensis TaxID=408015 RepID=UPI003420C4BC